MNTKTIAAIVFSISFTSFSQVKYYKNKEGKIIDSEKYLLKKKEHFDIYKMISSIKLNENLSEVLNSKDSLVYGFNWTMKVNDSPETDINYFDEEKYLNQEFPLFSLHTIDNEQISISKLKGKPTLISFWFIGCKPCIAEMPVLNQMKSDLNDSVNFISITFENRENVLKFLQKHEFNFIHLVDLREFIKGIGIDSYPKNIFLDKAGKVVRVENGLPEYSKNSGELKLGDEKVFEAILRKLL